MRDDGRDGLHSDDAAGPVLDDFVLLKRGRIYGGKGTQGEGNG